MKKLIKLLATLLRPFSKQKVNNSKVVEINENISDKDANLTNVIKVEKVGLTDDNFDDAETYFKMGNEKYSFKNYSGAIDDYSKAIELDPKYEKAYFTRGRAKYNNYDQIGAIEDYTKALEINPLSLDIYTVRGNARSGIKDYSGAIEDYTKVIEIDPSNSNAYLVRGNLKRNNKDYIGAIEDYSKVIEIDPMNETAYYNRGYYLLFKLNDYSRAIADFTLAIENTPFNNPMAYNNRGIAKYNTLDFNGAIADFTKAIDTETKMAGVSNDYNGDIVETYGEVDPENYYYRGLAKFQIHDYIGAIADFINTIDIQPEYTEAFLNRGNAELKLGNKEKANLDYQRVKELGFDVPEL